MLPHGNTMGDGTLLYINNVDIRINLGTKMPKISEKHNRFNEEIFYGGQVKYCVTFSLKRLSEIISQVFFKEKFFFSEGRF